MKAAISPVLADLAWKQKKNVKIRLIKRQKNWLTVTAPGDFQGAFFLERSLVHRIKAARFDAYRFVAIR